MGSFRLKKDFLVVVNEDAEAPKELFSFDPSVSGYATGFHKVIFKWLKCFLTEVGSDISNSAYGSEITQNLVGGADASILFRQMAEMSIDMATITVKKQQKFQAGLPASEKLSNVELEDLRLISSLEEEEREDTTPDTMELFLNLTSDAGDVATLGLPLELMDT